MAADKFVIAMDDIRGLAPRRDIDYVRMHAEPLSPGNFVPVSFVSSKFGGGGDSKPQVWVAAILGVVGIALIAIVAVKVRKMMKKS